MNIIQKPSPNFDERGGEEIKYLILHYTGMKTAEEAMERLCCAEAKVSSHYTIDEEGLVYQHVDEKKRAWHAGVSSWQGEDNINAKSIGIELVNPGHEFGYCKFTDAQLKTAKELCMEILLHHLGIKYVLAHSDIAPDRKQDPGELFPWKEFAKSGIGIWPKVDEAKIIQGEFMGDIVPHLKEFGYVSESSENLILAFQRHFVPEAFVKGTQGKVCNLTKVRLSGLLAGHLISSL